MTTAQAPSRYDEDHPLADLLMEVLPWVHAADRDYLVAEITENFGQAAGDLIHDMYEVHRINGTGD